MSVAEKNTGRLGSTLSLIRIRIQVSVARQMSVKQILIVEKDSLQAYLLEAKFREDGWGVRLVDAPAEALHCCERESFDAAIINFKYPGEVNGFELSRLFLEQHDLPSLMITATRYTELEKHPMFTSKQELIFKPYRLLECKQRLKAIW